MKSVAVTGTIGSGKSTVMRILSEQYLTISCDDISHELMQPGQSGYKQVQKAFPMVLDENQKINRQALAERIFSDAEAKKRLEGILHPLILKEVRDRLQTAQKENLVFVEVPLLFETGWEVYFDCNILVTSKKTVLYERLKQERGMTHQEITARLQNQMSVKEKRKRADYLIRNDGSIEQLQEQVLFLVNKLSK